MHVPIRSDGTHVDVCACCCGAPVKDARVLSHVLSMLRARGSSLSCVWCVSSKLFFYFCFARARYHVRVQNRPDHHPFMYAKYKNIRWITRWFTMIDQDLRPITIDGAWLRTTPLLYYFFVAKLPAYIFFSVRNQCHKNPSVIGLLHAAKWVKRNCQLCSCTMLPDL